MVHTNLGRAVLPPEALDGRRRGGRARYTDLEVEPGARRARLAAGHVRDVLCTLTGADDALVVNNNAAAVLLALAATAAAAR